MSDQMSVHSFNYAASLVGIMCNAFSQVSSPLSLVDPSDFKEVMQSLREAEKPYKSRNQKVLPHSLFAVAVVYIA